MKKNHYKVTTKGFTLVEMLVSLGLFSVVITIGIGTLLVMVDVNAKAQAVYSSATNLSYALDLMTRELRTGYHYYCTQKDPSDIDFDTVASVYDTNDCTSSDNANFITFVREKDGVQFGYRINNKVIEQYENTLGEWIPITSDKDVIIDTLKFIVLGSDTYDVVNDEDQPTIEIFIEGRFNNGLETDTEFSVQTHIVQHRLDIY